MTEQEKAREVADKLRKEKEDKEASEAQELEKVKSDLAVVSSNQDLAKMYNDSAKLGSENLGGSSPLLKVHQIGKSSSKLADGSDPDDGAFYYKPTQEQFKTLDCHILTTSKGFRAPGLEGEGKDLKFNQLLAGVFMVDGDYKPFVMYFNGKKLSPMWDFGKEASPYTHKKPVAIPMFALTVRLTTRSEKNSYSNSWLVDFEILKDKDGFPVLVTDPGEFQFLKDSVEPAKEMVKNIINSKTGGGEQLEPIQTGEDPGENNSGQKQPDDIPF